MRGRGLQYELDSASLLLPRVWMIYPGLHIRAIFPDKNVVDWLDSARSTSIYSIFVLKCCQIEFLVASVRFLDIVDRHYSEKNHSASVAMRQCTGSVTVLTSIIELF